MNNVCVFAKGVAYSQLPGDVGLWKSQFLCVTESPDKHLLRRIPRLFPLWSQWWSCLALPDQNHQKDINVPKNSCIHIKTEKKKWKSKKKNSWLKIFSTTTWNHIPTFERFLALALCETGKVYLPPLHPFCRRHPCKPQTSDSRPRKVKPADDQATAVIPPTCQRVPPIRTPIIRPTPEVA